MKMTSFRALEARATMLLADESGMSIDIIAAGRVSDSLRVQFGA